jgi:hypothetical protein
MTEADVQSRTFLREEIRRGRSASDPGEGEWIDEVLSRWGEHRVDFGAQLGEIPSQLDGLVR